MAYFKKMQLKKNQLWYPRSVIVGKPVDTDQVADKLAELSTVTRGDTYAVLKNLGKVLATYMTNGRSVKLEGIGTFYYSAISRGNGVETPEEVTAKQITATRVRFIPETTRTTSGSVSTRSLITDELFWQEWGGTTTTASTDDTTTDSGSSDEEEVNPFG